MSRVITVGIFLLLSAIMFPQDLNAQYGKKKKRRDKTEQSNVIEENFFRDKMWYGVNLGNPGFGGNVFQLGIGPMAAYKINNYLSTGIITNFNIQYLWNRFGSDETYLDYSIGVFGRARFFRSIFAHVEYNYTSLDREVSTERRTDFPILFLGGGYTSGMAPWGFEATLLFDVLGNLGNYRLPIVYRLGVTYNF